MCYIMFVKLSSLLNIYNTAEFIYLHVTTVVNFMPSVHVSLRSLLCPCVLKSIVQYFPLAISNQNSADFFYLPNQMNQISWSLVENYDMNMCMSNRLHIYTHVTFRLDCDYGECQFIKRKNLYLMYHLKVGPPLLKQTFSHKQAIQELQN